MTAHSEFLSLAHVYLKHPREGFVNQDKIDSEWKKLQYVHRPDFEKSLEEYHAFEELLRSKNIKIQYFSENHLTSIDSIYCRDASIITDHGVILCSMGKSERIPESAACQKDYEIMGLPILGVVKPPGKIEGGDVAWIDEKTLAVAHGYRTNDEGFRQIRMMLAPYGIQVIQVDLPHYQGEKDVFHLMSIFSPIDRDRAVVYSPLMPIRFRQELLHRGYHLIEVPHGEFLTMGCNVLALDADTCIMVEGNPITKNQIEKSGSTVLTYPGEEISIKGGGGPTCLTRPIKRNIV